MNTKINTGNAGEFFVAGELARRGFTVALPTAKVEDIDLLAMNPLTFKTFAIQVKTNKKGNDHWLLTNKNESLQNSRLYYVFVDLNETESPRYHIVPSARVAKDISTRHKNWLATPGKNGKKHNDSPVRKFVDAGNQYEGRWELLQ